MPFTRSQSRIILVIGLLIYAAAMGAIVAWLALNGEETTQRRLDSAVTVTAMLPGKEPSVPSSWQKKPEAPAEAEEETPPATPEAMPEKQEVPKQEEAAAVQNEEKPAQAEPVAEPEQVVETPAAEPAQEAVAEASPPAAQARWQKYARPFDQSDNRPRIGLVIVDLGLANAATQTAIQDLPGEVSLAFSSSASDLEGWISKARVAGHETILSVPMEPDNYPQNDPGPNTLLTGLDDKDNVSRIRWAMARAEGYVAVMPYMGEKFVTSEKKLAPVLDAVQDQGLMVLDGTMNRNSLIAPLSRLGSIPFTRSDMILDAAASRAAIEEQLAALEKTAREKGHAIGIALPYPVTFERLKQWIPTLEKKGFVLAPVTALASEDVGVTQ